MWFVLVVSLGVFVLMRRPFADAIDGRTYGRWRNVWLAYTTLAFFIPNYWGFLLLSGIAIYFLALQEQEKTGRISIAPDRIADRGAFHSRFRGHHTVY